MVRRARGAAACAVAAAAIAAACTTEDADESVVAQQSAGATDVRAAAAAFADVTSGTIAIHDTSVGGPHGDQSTEASASFSGSDRLLRVRTRVPGSAGDAGPSVAGSSVDYLIVGDSTYVGPEVYGAATGWLSADIAWIDVSMHGDPNTEYVTERIAATTDLYQRVFEQAEVITELDPESVGGTSYRTFDVELPVHEAMRLIRNEADGSRGEGSSEENGVATPRRDAIAQFGREHTTAEVTVLVDDSGQLRRVEVDVVSQVPPEFADCALLAGFVETVHSVTDITDHGRTRVDPPDPATVIAADEVDALLPTAREATEASEKEDDLSRWLETADGAMWLREELEWELSIDGATSAIDPAVLQALSDDALVAAWEERLAARVADEPSEPVVGELSRKSDDEFEGCPG